MGAVRRTALGEHLQRRHGQMQNKILPGCGFGFAGGFLSHPCSCLPSSAASLTDVCGWPCESPHRNNTASARPTFINLAVCQSTRSPLHRVSFVFWHCRAQPGMTLRATGTSDPFLIHKPCARRSDHPGIHSHTKRKDRHQADLHASF